MFDGIYGWLRDVAVFFILMTAVLNILPEAKYRKYVQFFLGLVMMVVLCRPILALGNLESELEDMLGRLTLEEEIQGMEESQIQIDGMQQEVLYGAYEGEIENQIGVFLEGKGMEPVEVDVSIGDGSDGEILVERIEVTAGMEMQEEETGKRERELKKELSEVYQVSEAHIIVKLQE